MPEVNTRPLDAMIGRLDRLLSEFLVAVDDDLDEADWQTMKHHADDLIGVGNAALERLRAKKAEVQARVALQPRRKDDAVKDRLLSNAIHNATKLGGCSCINGCKSPDCTNI